MRFLGWHYCTRGFIKESCCVYPLLCVQGYRLRTYGQTKTDCYGNFACHLSFPGSDLQTEHNYEVYLSSRENIILYRPMLTEKRTKIIPFSRGFVFKVWINVFDNTSYALFTSCLLQYANDLVSQTSGIISVLCWQKIRNRKIRNGSLDILTNVRQKRLPR
jgi:hypothetical protein